jgi:regulatory Fis family protein
MSGGPLSLHEAISAFKRRLILHALFRHDGNRSRAAVSLGIERTSLLRLMRELGIDLPRGRRQQTTAVPHGFTDGCRRCHIDRLRIRMLESLPTYQQGRAS